MYATWLSYTRGGLKGKISNDFLAFGRRTWQGTRYTYEDDGQIRYLLPYVWAQADETAHVIAGDLRPDQVWIGGVPVGSDCRRVRLWKGFNSIVLRYAGVGRTHFLLSHTEEPRLSSRRFPLSMDWYHNPDVYPYHLSVAPSPVDFCFQTPPGMASMRFASANPPEVTLDGIRGVAKATGNRLQPHRNRRVQHVGEPLQHHPHPLRRQCSVGPDRAGDADTVIRLSQEREVHKRYNRWPTDVPRFHQQNRRILGNPSSQGPVYPVTHPPS